MAERLLKLGKAGDDRRAQPHPKRISTIMGNKVGCFPFSPNDSYSGRVIAEIRPRSFTRWPRRTGRSRAFNERSAPPGGKALS